MCVNSVGIYELGMRGVNSSLHGEWGCFSVHQYTGLWTQINGSEICEKLVLAWSFWASLSVESANVGLGVSEVV